MVACWRGTVRAASFQNLIGRADRGARHVGCEVSWSATQCRQAYSYGRLAPAPADAAPTWRRVADTVRRLVLDPRAGSVLGRLHQAGLIYDRQMAAGLKVGEAYGRVARLKGLGRRDCGSPAFILAYSSGGSPLAPEERMTAEERRAADRRVRRAERLKQRILDCLPPDAVMHGAAVCGDGRRRASWSRPRRATR